MKRSEQKLVDTMLTADMIYLAQAGVKDVCLVSSDDDLWVGIRTAILLGANVTQIHTMPGRDLAAFYARGVGPGYTQKHF